MKGILTSKLKTYYAKVNLKEYRRNFSEAINFYGGNKFKDILDIGSGVGSFEDATKSFGFNSFALEGSEIGLEACLNKNINCQKFILEKGNKIPFEDGRFSLVFMNQVIEHLDKETGQFYISEIIRVLESGGVGIINSPSKYCRIWNTDPHHVYCWKPNELYSEIKKYKASLGKIEIKRIPLELWMLFRYNEKIIDDWHKNVKYPKIKMLSIILAHILDKILNVFFKTDKLLAVSNVIIIKK